MPIPTTLPKPKNKRTINSLIKKLDGDDVFGLCKVFATYDMSKHIPHLLKYAAEQGKEQCGLWLLDYAAQHKIELPPRLSFFIAYGGSIPMLERFLFLTTPSLKEEFQNTNPSPREEPQVPPLGGKHLIGAATAGWANMIEFVLDRSEKDTITREEKNMALCWASHNGHLNAVKKLSAVADPKADCSLALQWAFKSGKRDVIDFLVPLCNLREALYDMHKKWKNDMAVIREIEAFEERRLIVKGLQDHPAYEEALADTKKKPSKKM